MFVAFIMSRESEYDRLESSLLSALVIYYRIYLKLLIIFFRRKNCISQHPNLKTAVPLEWLNERLITLPYQDSTRKYLLSTKTDNDTEKPRGEQPIPWAGFDLFFLFCGRKWLREVGGPDFAKYTHDLQLLTVALNTYCKLVCFRMIPHTSVSSVRKVRSFSGYG